MKVAVVTYQHYWMPSNVKQLLSSVDYDLKGWFSRSFYTDANSVVKMGGCIVGDTRIGLGFERAFLANSCGNQSLHDSDRKYTGIKLPCVEESCWFDCRVLTLRCIMGCLLQDLE